MATRAKTTKAKKSTASRKAGKGASRKAPIATKQQRPKAAAEAGVLAPDSGSPVTLEQARALAQVQRPLAARRAGPQRAVVAEVTPGTVGIERRKLEIAQRDEMKRRIADYKATMSIMKKRGVKGLPPVPDAAVAADGTARRRRAPAARAAGLPLQILAEGDSWFDYPVPFFGGGVVPRLESRLGVPVLNLAKAGDEVRFMMGVTQRKLISRHLSDGCPAGGPWDVVLFSGGGNDIVADPMALWIKDFDAAIPIADHIDHTRFDAALSLIRAGYEDIISLRDKISPGTQLVLHGYDFAIPDGRGVCHLGPWLKPTFDLRGFASQAVATEVVKAMLQRFASMLQSLQARPGVTVIQTQGVLAPQTSSWHNELHPSKAGFKRFAELFHEKLKELFPDRVLA